MDIQRVAKLAALRISDQRITMLRAQVSDILQMVDTLPPLSEKEGAVKDTVTITVDQLRADVVQPSLPRTAALQNAPCTSAGCIVAPKMER